MKKILSCMLILTLSFNSFSANCYAADNFQNEFRETTVSKKIRQINDNLALLKSKASIKADEKPIEENKNISKEEIIAQGLVSREDYELMEKYTYALFQRGTEMAAEKGLILVDTKYEFGKKNGKIYLIDEIHTPDSSRYFYADGYAERFAKGEKQKQLSKEFVREWLMDNGFQGQTGQKVPEMTPEVISGITDRYIELYEHITGQKFEKAENTNVLKRIEDHVNACLKTL